MINKKLPYIYFKTKSFHVYLRLWKLDDEWIGVSYSVRAYNLEEFYQGGSPLSNWYHDDLTVLLNEIDELMIMDEYVNTFEPLDDPYLDIVLKSKSGKKHLRINFYWDLTESRDHLSVYLNSKQIENLNMYLSLATGKITKDNEQIKILYDQGILQGD
ncbi:hypothetical protein O2U01_06970 [Ligilactobacillus salivarius]|uniref:Uncharacterized protein n=1 Tax=Ligilactobacillus salivarius TaxID=1624 RepID=A0ABD7YX25_9LACO|nr:hypothetical protein [Ligilactobacillus salivarius]WHS06830.1 hypothetical protein O2U07_06000 [Ligilactobacillus salivarius]WHS08766.1 hypothetical protein O2U05_04760 [Ligilactobacillus salivarius]WHS10792.1 hypothetical protein O2U04_04335 [Ligilactobacillus salivarius]WHS14731.1 hypothetical protein O2U03_03540 [Ligilactobacillus salivarius]WHS18369.1 hypothetical protein O2U02_03895 [Ligilactobacillus salivarius]